MHAPASFLFDGVNPCFASMQLTYWLLWGGSLALSVTLVILLWTRWGHSRPLHKCAALSLIVHLILAFLTMTVRIVNGDGGGDGGGGPPIHVRIVEEAIAPPAPADASNARATPAIEDISEVAPPPLFDPPTPEKVEPPPSTEPEAAPPIADLPPNVPAKKTEALNVAKEAPTAVAKTGEAKPLEKPESKQTPPTQPTAAKVDPPSGVAVTSATKSVDSESTTTPMSARAVESATAIASTPYSLRSAPDRLGLVAGQGGNAETEAAVAAALRWLAAAQARDGRWVAVQFGAGQEELTLGQNRGGAGRSADTGITALALLAFLGAGHSHVQGEYQETVRRGLDFLLRAKRQTATCSATPRSTRECIATRWQHSRWPRRKP